MKLAFTEDEIDGLLRDDPDAFLLLAVLCRNQWGGRAQRIGNPR